MRYFVVLSFTLIILRFSSFAAGKLSSDMGVLHHSSAPLQFTENKGQLGNNEVIFISNSSSGINAFFFKNSFSYVIAKPDTQNDIRQVNKPIGSIRPRLNDYPRGTFQRIDVEFVNSNQNPEIIAGEPVNGISNYYLANCPDGVHASSFQSVTYKNLYPDIDVVFKGALTGGMEYDFILKPGANPNDIQMKYTGTSGATLKGQTLVIQTITGTLQEVIPQVYQTKSGLKTLLHGSYEIVLSAPGLEKTNATRTCNVKFSIPSYNNLDTLIIDPWVTYYTSTTGGNNTTSNNSTYLQGITLDPAGHIIVQGYSNSPYLPTTPGVFDASKDTGVAYSTDITVAEFDTAGHRLWATYYGGSDFEFVYPNGIATDYAGNIFLSAETRSHDFPVSSGAFQSTYQGGGNDDCIIKLDSTGNRLWATYLGGSQMEYSGGISADPAGNVVVTGGTESTNFPVSANAFQKTNRSSSYYNAFITKFDPSGNMIWSTYYGGSLSDIGLSLTTDKNSNIIMASTSCSTDYPVSPGAYQTVNHGPTGFGYGSGDIVLVKMDSSGNRLWATFYGGTGQEAAEAVTVDDSTNIYITGSTYYSTFPTTPGVYQSVTDNNGFALAVKFSPDGIPVWSTVLSGTSNGGHWCYAMGIAVDKAHNVYLAGNTIDNGSPPDDFPSTACAYQPASAGGQSWFFSKFDPLAQHLLYSSYLGGYTSGSGYGNHCNGLTFANNTFYLCGYCTGDITNPSDFPVTPGAFETTPSGTYNNDGVIAAIPVNTNTIVNFAADHPKICGLGDTVYFTNLSTLACSLPADSARYYWYFPGGTPGSSNAINPAGVVYDTAGTFDVTLVISTSLGKDTLIKNAYISISSGTSGAGSIAANPSTICAGDSSQLTFTGAGGNIQWQSSTGGSYAVISGADSAIYNTSTLSQSTGFRVIVTNGTCPDTSAITKVVVDSLPSPPALYISDSLICSSDSTLITASAGYNTYLWNTGDTLNHIFAETGGSYWVTVTNSYGCMVVSHHQNVTVYPVPSVSITEQGDTLSSFNSSSYQWLFNDSIIPGATGPVYVAQQTGNYAVQVLDSNGCTTVSNNTYVEISSIANMLYKSGIYIYPDPFTESVYIKTDHTTISPVTVTLYNILGETLIEKKVNSLSFNPLHVDVSKLPAGAYYVRVEGPGISYEKKMIKE